MKQALSRLGERRSRGRPKHDDILTPREWQVFQLLEEGLTNKEIALRLGISDNGVKYHVAEIISKMGVSNRGEAVTQLRAERTAGFAILPWLTQLRGANSRAFGLAVAAVVFASVFALAGAVFVLLPVIGGGGSDSPGTSAMGDGDISNALADFQGQPGEGPAVRLDDPVAYCQTVGTIDTPDSRYVGAAMPDWMPAAFAAAVGISPDTAFRENPPALVWRCANGRVLACTYGANIPCDSKANTNEQPTPAMVDWCTSPPPNFDPAMPFIPAFVVGHETIYSWECREGAPVISGQPQEVDAQGYVARFWHQVVP